MATTEPTTTEPTDTGETLPAQPTGGDDELAELIAHGQSLTVEDPAEVQERIVRQMMRSQNVGDLLRAGEATPAADLYNVPLRFLGIRASESDYVDGADLYLHIEARIIGNGDAVTVSCGARDVVVKLLLADMRKWFPFDAMIVQSTKATAAGYYPVFLRQLDDAGDPL